MSEKGPQGPSMEPSSPAERAAGAYDAQSYDADQAFDPEARRATNEWRGYLEGRPDENGLDISGDQVETPAYVSGDVLSRDEEGRFEGGISTLANAYNDAVERGDRTLIGDIEDEIEQRAVDIAENRKPEAKHSSGDLSNEYTDQYLERWFTLTGQMDGDATEEIEVVPVDVELANDNIPPLEGDGGSEPAVEAGDGGDPNTQEMPVLNPNSLSSSETTRMRRWLGAAIGAGGLLVGAAVGLYIGNKTGVHITSPRGISEQLEAGGHGFSALGRASARVENFMRSMTGVGAEWSPSEAIRSLNPFGGGGKSYMREVFENSTPGAKGEWGRRFTSMMEYVRPGEKGAKSREGNLTRYFDALNTASRGAKAAVNQKLSNLR